MSNVSRGAYFKARTRKWLSGRGYQVAEMEIIRWVFRPGSTRIPIKRDQFGSDLIAMSDTEIIFVQVKGGESARTGNFPEAQRAFNEFKFPVFTKRWIVAWPPRSREPRIVVVP